MDLLRELFDRQKTSLDYFFQTVDVPKIQQTIDFLLECRGTIALSGVGKSGLIAQKISATLVSTGTRSIFLNPSNALHGDIGLLSPGDVLIAFSKSGQTQELLDLMPHVAKKGATAIAVVSSAHSKLEQAASFAIHLPVLRELCPFDLAPTVSTSIQLIFGDILAIALMHKKQFSVGDFAQNHPAGLLGRKITLRVADLMFKGDTIPLCKPTDKLIDVLHELSVKRCGCLLAVDEHMVLQGIFTDGDLRRSIQTKGAAALQSTLSELMTISPQSISPDRLAVDAVRLMEEDPKRLITVLPVLESGRVVGLVRMHDILQSGLH